MSNWELFIKLRDPAKTPGPRPQITLGSDGRWRLNALAAQLCGEQVQVLWDAARRRVGLRPVPPGTPDSWRIISQASGSRTEAHLVMGRFVQTYDIAACRGTYPLTAEDGLFTFTLPSVLPGNGSDSNPSMLTSRQVADALGFSISRLQILRRQWQIGRQIGHYWYYTPEELEQLQTRPKRGKINE